MPREYATVEETLTHIQYTDVVDGALNARVVDLIQSASELIDRETGHPDGFVAATSATARVYQGSGTPYQSIDECVEITQVEVKDAATDDDYDIWPTTDWIAYRGSSSRPNFNTLPYTALMIDPTGTESLFTEGVRTVRVTAKWGYAETCPPTINMATVMTAGRWFKRLRSAMADVVGSPETGELRYVKALDPAVLRLLSNGRFYRRVGRGGAVR